MPSQKKIIRRAEYGTKLPHGHLPSSEDFPFTLTKEISNDPENGDRNVNGSRTVGFSSLYGCRTVGNTD
jgi:hypothetical protein